MIDYGEIFLVSNPSGGWIAGSKKYPTLLGYGISKFVAEGNLKGAIIRKHMGTECLRGIEMPIELLKYF